MATNTNTASNARIRAAIKKFGRKRVEAALKKSVAKHGEAEVRKALSRPSDGTTPTPKVTQQPSKQEQVTAAAKGVARGKARAEAARKKRAKEQKAFEVAKKRFGGTENILKAAERKFGVNSPEYRRAKIAATKFGKTVTPTIRKVKKVKKKIEPIDVTKGLSSDQYTNLINKFGDPESVQAATVNRFGVNSVQAKKMQELLNRFNQEKTEIAKKIREKKTTITDASKVISDTDIAGISDVPTFKGVSVVDFLKSTKQDSSFTNRAKLAASVGIKNYEGTAAQNTELLNKLKDKTAIEEKVEEEIPSLNGEEVKEDIEPTEEKRTHEQNLAKLNQNRAEGKTDEALLAKTAEKFGEDSEEYRALKAFIEANPPKDGTEDLDASLLEKNKRELAEAQIEALKNQKGDNINTTVENFQKGADIIAGNNTALQEFYKTMTENLATFLEDAKQKRADALQRTKTTELNKVVGQIRATLARRGIDIGNIAPEQLIAMSGELGSKALENINNAITEMEDSIITLTEEKTKEINGFLEKGLVKQSEADLSIEQMRQLKEKMISDIKSNFITNVFKISQASIADADKTKAEVLNAISTFTEGLGVTASAQGLLEDYMEATDSVTAIQNMITDLNDPESRLFKAVADAEKAAQLAAQFAAKIEIMKATKSTSAAASGSKKLGETTLRSLIAAGIPNASSYTTYGELEAAMNANPELAEKITEAISKANAISVADVD